MPWNDVLTTAGTLAGMTELSLEACADFLECEFEEVAPGHYRAQPCNSHFATVEIRLGESTGWFCLTLAPSTDRAGYAEEAKRLGPGIDVDIVSPPLFDPTRPKARPLWDRKYSVCHVIGGRRVWFGFEETDGVERLVTITGR